MAKRVPASMRTRESLSELIEGRLSSAAGRAELVKLATRLIDALCDAVSKPVNVVMGLAGATLSVDQLAGAGVTRISLGSALSRVALGALLRAAREIKEQGTFGFAEEAPGFGDLYPFLPTQSS